MAAITGNQVNIILLYAYNLDILETTGDGGKLVCNEELNFTNTANVIERSTKCSQLKAVGEVSGEVSFSGVAELTPSVGFISHEKLLTWANAKTPLVISFQDNEDAPNYFRSAVGYISSYSEDSKVDDFVSFTATIVTTNYPVVGQ